MVAVDEELIQRRERTFARAISAVYATQYTYPQNSNSSAVKNRLGRIASQQWTDSTGAVVDGYTYAYDPNSNVTSKTNVLNSAYSETYTNDNLNRLTAVTRGGCAYQSWNLDSQGNWSSSTTSGTTQTRTTHNQNQITSITGTAGTPQYDPNGNMTTDQNGNTLKYDAWNRLISVTNSSGQIIAEYSYDARGYRVSETYPQGGAGVPAGTTNYIYYDSNWQAIEVRTNGTAASDVTSQTVWSAAYVNAPVLQDSFSGGVIQPNSRIYFLHDANWNTTATVAYNSSTSTWNIAQRYVYSPYGYIQILNPDWSVTPTGTQSISDYLYQGMALDAVTGLYYARNRNYSPSLGVWLSQDPAQYINGANTYQMEMSGPVGSVDPSGLGVAQYLSQHQYPVAGLATDLVELRYRRSVTHLPSGKEQVHFSLYVHHFARRDWFWSIPAYDEGVTQMTFTICPDDEQRLNLFFNGQFEDWKTYLAQRQLAESLQSVIAALVSLAAAATASFGGELAASYAAGPAASAAAANNVLASTVDLANAGIVPTDFINAASGIQASAAAAAQYAQLGASVIQLGASATAGLAGAGADYIVANNVGVGESNQAFINDASLSLIGVGSEGLGGTAGAAGAGALDAVNGYSNAFGPNNPVALPQFGQFAP